MVKLNYVPESLSISPTVPEENSIKIIMISTLQVGVKTAYCVFNRVGWSLQRQNAFTEIV